MADKRMNLALDKIKIDGGTQSRLEIDQDHVGELTEVLGNGDKFKDPLDVFFDGGVYWLADGFHRYYAYIAANRKVAAVLVHQGDLRAAVLYSIGANAKHGKRRTLADRRRAVTRLLEDHDWCGRSDRWIAGAAKVSNHLVQVIRGEFQQAAVSDEPKAASTGRSPSSISESPEKN